MSTYITAISPWSPPSSRSTSPGPSTQPRLGAVAASTSSAPTTSNPPSAVPANIITQHRNQPKLGFLNILAIGLYAFASTSFISAPFAGGWFSYVLLSIVAAAAFWNSLDLGRCCTTQRQTYEDVCGTAFPRVGRLSGGMLVFILSFSTCIGTLMVQKGNLQYILPQLGILLTFVLIANYLIIVCICTIREECSWIPGNLFLQLLCL
ncbi:amino acid transporter AVT1I-like [Bidens hawaiensis]|uniref:amino acid transporter AVT1I-like n=1 Tax=Bidens hawaiensis TaxID=980011 RepID=UPI0040493EF2